MGVTRVTRPPALNAGKLGTQTSQSWEAGGPLVTQSREAGGGNQQNMGDVSNDDDMNGATDVIM